MNKKGKKQKSNLTLIEDKKIKRNYFGVLKGIDSFTKKDKAKGQLD